MEIDKDGQPGSHVHSCVLAFKCQTLTLMEVEWLMCVVMSCMTKVFMKFVQSWNQTNNVTHKHQFHNNTQNWINSSDGGLFTEQLASCY